jgi:hypothetical protein
VRRSARNLSNQTKERISDTAETVREQAVATKDRVQDGVEATVDTVRRNAAAIGDGASQGFRVYREQLEATGANGGTASKG